MEQGNAPQCMDVAGTYQLTREDDFEVLFRLSPDAIVVAGLDGIIRRLNPAASAASGYAEEELVGSDLRRVVHPDDLPRVESSMEQLALHGHVVAFESRVIAKSGAVLWYEWNGVRIDAERFVTTGRDISARKEAERTLAMADAAMGKMAQGYWIYRKTPRAAFHFSPELAALFQAGELTEEEFLARVHPEDRARLAQEIATAHADPVCDSLVVQYRIVRPDGAVRTHVFSARLLRDGSGAFIEAIGTTQDITRQCAIESSLRRHQDLTAAIFDTTGALVVVIDREGTIVRVNSAVEQLTGWRRDELDGKLWEVLIPEGERAAVRQHFDHLSAALFPNTQTNTWLTRDGRRVAITWSNTAILDVKGAVEYVIATGIDITGLQRMHDDLQVARHAYRRLLELTFDMVLTQSLDGTILDINSAGAHMLGASGPEEIIGLHLRDIVCPEHLQMALGGLQCIYHEEIERRLSIESQHMRRDGSMVDVELIAVIATTWDGRPAVQTLVRDITELKRARNAMQAREHYFESLAELAPAGIFQLDQNGSVVYANSRCAEILGTDEMVGTAWEACVEPEDRARVQGILAQAVRERRPFSLEFRCRRSDGELVWLCCKSIIDGAGSGGYIGSLVDVTAFKVLNEQLHEAEQRARRVVELSFDVILTVESEQLLITDINHSGAALLRGTSVTEFVGRPVIDFFRQADQGDVTECIRGALETGAASGMRECTLLRADGTLMEVEGTAIPVTVGGVPTVYVICRDITERKSNERARLQREHQLATLAKAAPVGIFQTDVHGQVTFANGRYQEVTGYTSQEIEGSSWWEYVVPEDRERVRLHWHEVAEHAGAFDLEFRMRRKSDKVIWVLGQAVPERSGTGEVLGFIGSITDVNQSKVDEIELRNYREHLEEMVRERTLELEAVNRELESFSYSVSHDLRAPLRAINGFNSALLDEYGDKLDDQARFFLRRMQANTRQMAQLIDDMMQLSKVTQAELSYERVDLSALAAVIVAEMRMTDPSRQVEVTIEPQLTAVGDAQLLAILMQNLLGNAWKYTGRNAGPARIEFGAINEGGSCTFFVKDNGVGFDMSCAADLFHAFRRLHDSSEFEGTGVGLATVNRVVSRHGGRVWGEGEEGKGATFFFVIPVLDRASILP